MMSVPLDSNAVKHAISVDGVRVWATRRPERISSHAAVTAIRLETKDQVIRSVAQRDVRLFVGSVASHGIIEPLRARFPEYTFESLPSGRFDVVLQTTAGVERYHVTPQRTQPLLPVCNAPR